MFFYSLTLGFFSLLPSLSSAATNLGIEGNVAIDPLFADPSIILVDDIWYAFSSATNGYHVPAAISTDSYYWSKINESDILPDLPSWAIDNNNVWAPDVSQRSDGTFVLYFSAGYKGADPAYHCIGVATSSTILGPYTPTSDTEPWVCNAELGGAIDPNLFYDTSSGLTYVVWKVDGNNFGNGGNCNNGVEPIVSTPIMIQQVSTSDYYTKIDSAIEILDRSDADGPLVEAPALVRGNNGEYILFFSSNCYSGSLYDLSYAYSTSVTGPYTKSSSPLLATGTYDGLSLISPGSCDVYKMSDYIKIAFHGDVGEVDPSERGMYIMDAHIVGTTVTWS